MPEENTNILEFNSDSDTIDESIDNLELVGVDALDQLDTDMNTMFTSLDTAFPDRVVRPNFKNDLRTAQVARENGDADADSLFTNLRIQWRNAVTGVDTIVDTILAGEPYNVYEQAPNADGELQFDGTYKAIKRAKEQEITVIAPELATALVPTVIDNTNTTTGNTVVTFKRFSKYRRSVLNEIDLLINQITETQNIQKNISPPNLIDYSTNLDILQSIQNRSATRNFGIKPKNLFNWANSYGFSNLTADEIAELDDIIFKETKTLGYTRVKKIAQQIIRYMKNNLINDETDVDALYELALSRVKAVSRRDRIAGLSFTGNDDNYAVVYGYTFTNIMERSKASFIDDKFKDIGSSILQIITKYKQEIIHINAYKRNTRFGPKQEYLSTTTSVAGLYTEETFVPHMMYNPVTGEGVNTQSYAEHVRYSALGYVHTKPETTTTDTEDTTTATTPSTTSTVSTGTSTTSTSTSTSTSSGYSY